ncbi:MAG TPA: hypothetical protein VNE16_14765 [Vicinamibacterales bacterium]|nr:hypothetical protein [Vicinamibacterales bacterium]
MALFSAAWLFWGVATLSPPASWWGPVSGLLLVMVFALVLAGRRAVIAIARTSTPRARVSPFRRPAYRRAVMFEAVAIPVAVVLLDLHDLATYIPPVVAAIVGVHFFGLVAAFRTRLYWWVGLAMCAIAGLSVALAPVADWATFVALGCGAVLWCTALGRIVRIRRRLSPASAA